MKEHSNNHHHKDPDIPEGLEYQDAYWQDALSKIERQERLEDRKKRWGWLALSSLLVAILWIGIKVNSNDKVVASNSNDNNTTATSHNLETQNLPTLPEQGIQTREEGKEPTTNESSEKFKNDAAAKSNMQNGLATNSQPIQKEQTFKTKGIEKRSDKQTQIKTKAKQSELNKNTYPQSDLNASPLRQNLTNNDVRGAGMEASDATSSDNVDINKNDLEAADGMQHRPAEYINSRFGVFDDFSRGLMTGIYLPYSKPWIEPTWRYGAYLGMSLVTHYASPLRDVNTDVLVGMRIERNVKNRWAFRTGLEYYSIGNVRRPYSVTSIAYDINYIKTVTTVETHRLYYLSVPFTAGYRLNQKHQLWLGGGISYMLTGENEISTHRVTAATTELLDKHEDSGFVEGFADFPLFAHVGYEWRMTSHLFCNVGLQYGLTDITDNQYFNNPGIDRNTRLMFVLGYDFNKK